MVSIVFLLSFYIGELPSYMWGWNNYVTSLGIYLVLTVGI